MSHPFSLLQPRPHDLDRLLREADASDLTYSEVGATRAELPAGYRHQDVSGVMGTGQPVFDRAKDGLRRWQAHRGSGLEVHPVDAPLEPGATVLVLMKLGPMHARAACRIVYVVDEPDSYGFAYGTLALHPEQGEEAFLVERHADGTVHFRVKAFSRHGHVLSRLGGPLSHRIQARALSKYVTAMQSYCALAG